MPAIGSEAPRRRLRVSLFPRLPGSLRVRLTLLYGAVLPDRWSGAAWDHVRACRPAPRLARQGVVPARGRASRLHGRPRCGTLNALQAIIRQHASGQSVRVGIAPPTRRQLAAVSASASSSRDQGDGRSRLDQVVAASQHGAERPAIAIARGAADRVGDRPRDHGAGSILLGWLVAGRALRPLRTMNMRAREITEDNLHERLASRRTRRRARRAGVHLRRRCSGGSSARSRPSAGSSPTPRTSCARRSRCERALVEVALADPDASRAESLRRTCERVLVAGEQQERVIEALLTLARGQARDRASRAASTSRRSPAGCSQLGSRRPGRSTSGSSSRRPSSTATEALLERLVANLLDNAIVHNIADDGLDPSDRDPRGSPDPARRQLPAGDRPADGVDQLFEPFRRLAESVPASADGLGLGLSIVSAIASAHGAEVCAAPADAGWSWSSSSRRRSTQPAGAPMSVTGRNLAGRVARRSLDFGARWHRRSRVRRSGSR